MIPAILANGQQLAGVVSRQATAGEGVSRFGTMAEAIAALPSDTAFFIASPPTVHFRQAIAALEAGHDVIVEKPAFVSPAEAEAAVQAAEASGSLLVEGFMNRHTATHRIFLEQWAAGPLKAVECVFTIPAVPEGTFRTDTEIGASNLYDVASYVLSALIDAGASLQKVRLDRVDNPGRPEQERLHMSGMIGDVHFSSVTGVAEHYENVMRLTRVDGSDVSFTPFIYGRSGPRRMLGGKGGEVIETVVEDVNAFEAMLATPLSDWRKTAMSRGRRMIELTRSLERLGLVLSEYRAAAR